MSDVVRLIVEDREFTGWTGVTISMDIDQMADAFSLTAPFDPERAELREAFKPFGYQRVQVYLDDEILITGRIDKIEPDANAQDRTFTVQGRSLPGALVDCHIDGKLEYSGLALSTIARQLAAPFGIQIRADNDTNPLETGRAEYGQTIEDFLRSLAAPRRLFLNSSYDGKLVISWGSTLTARDPVAALVEGKGSWLSIQTAFDGQKRFSRYVVASQYAGQPNIEASVTDEDIPVYRPQLMVSKDMDTDPAVVAGKARTAAITEAVGIKVAVSGWRRPDGRRWAERQVVTLKAPSAMLYTERRYLIAGVSLQLDVNSGRTTTLRLVFPEIYAGAMPEVMPWD